MSSSLETRRLSLPPGMTVEAFSGDERPDLLREIEMLRVRVWRDTGFKMKAGHEHDTHWGDHWDVVGKQFAVLFQGKVIAATRVTVHSSLAETPYPAWFENVRPEPSPPLLFISRLVVDLNFQRRGLSDILDQKCIQLGRLQGAGALICDVPEYRIEPLLRRGFTITCEPKLGILFPEMRFSGMILRLG